MPPDSTASPPPLRVTVVTKMPSPYQVELFDEISRQGEIDLRVVYLTTEDGLHPWESPALNHPHLLLSRLPESWKQAWTWCEEANLTVFNFYTHPFAFTAIYARATSGRPWVFWGERPGYLGLGVSARWIRKILLQPLNSRSVSIWGVGNFALEGYKQEWGDKKRYFNLPYFSDLSRFNQDDHSTHEERVILYSGLLNKRKNVLSLARAFLVVASSYSNARLWILGAGPLEDEMRELLKPVQKQVEWLGFRPWEDLPGIYQKADIFCLPSRHDGWGMVIVEALAAGLPTVATTMTGAAREFVKDGENGWLVAPGDHKKLADALTEAVSAPESRLQQMRTAARQSVADHSLATGARRFADVARKSFLASGSSASIERRVKVAREHASEHVLLAGNYPPDGQPSMHRYAQLVKQCLDDHGVPNTLVRPYAILRRPWLPTGLARLAGYGDKFLIFPLLLRWTAARLAPGKKLLIHLLDQGNSLYLTCAFDFYVLATCHDLIAIRAALGDIDSAQRPTHGPWIQLAILRALERTTSVICVSNATLDDCRRLFPSPQPKLSYVPNPLDPSFSNAPLAENDGRLPTRYILHVGNNSWYKNRKGLFCIYAELRRLLPSAPPLVLMGAGLLKEETDLLDKLDLTSSCVVIEKPDDATIRSGYQNAECLIFPSLIEGFGWPILEAMACGCPVFTTNRQPMMEVGGDAAEYIDPENPPAAASLIADRLSKGDSWRKGRVEAGKERVKAFTFERFSSGLLEAYSEAFSAMEAVELQRLDIPKE